MNLLIIIMINYYFVSCKKEEYNKVLIAAIVSYLVLVPVVHLVLVLVFVLVLVWAFWLVACLEDVTGFNLKMSLYIMFTYHCH